MKPHMHNPPSANQTHLSRHAESVNITPCALLPRKRLAPKDAQKCLKLATRKTPGIIIKRLISVSTLA